MTFQENTTTGLQLSDSLLGLPTETPVFEMAFIDVDGDGDRDFFSGPPRDLYYENTGTPENAIFVKQDNGALACQGENIVIIDLNGDDQVDRVCGDKTVILSSLGGHIKTNNIFQNPSFSDELSYKRYQPLSLDINQDGVNEISITRDDYGLNQINDTERGISFYKVYSTEESNAAFTQCGAKGSSSFSRFDDFNGDNRVDFFTIDDLNSKDPRIVYCENKGSSDSPLFSLAVDVPSFTDIGLSAPLRLGFGIFMLGDINGDGDSDLYVKSKLYDNIGTPETPVFKHISYTFIDRGLDWVDANGDSQIDSMFLHGPSTRFINKGLEPAIGVSAEAYGSGVLIIAINRPSQVQLYRCNIYGFCQYPTVLPNTAKEVSISIGNFSQKNDGDEIALAIVDQNGLIDLNIYSDSSDGNLKLIRYGQGTSAHSVSISSGQLDSDSEDEIALSFVQEDGTVLAAAINFDMSIIGLTQQGQGKNPSIAIGSFSDISGSYALSYITPDNQLKISTFQGNGTLINQGSGGAADATISKATFISGTSTDEYVVSTIQTNGVTSLVGFSSEGNVLGKLTGGVAQQSTVISRYSPTGESIGLTVSIIQADKKPAVIFLDNKGNYLATGVGGKTAVVSTVTDGAYSAYSTVLAYIDEDGVPRWETFSANGVKQP